MTDTTTVLAIPFPEGSDANDVPADMQALAERLDDVPGIESLTSAQITALTAGQKPAGRVVYNSTTSKLQVSNGTSFADVDAAALLKAGGTMAGNIAMGNNKVTGLAAATTNGDAVRYEQALLLSGGTMSGAVAMGGNKVTGLAAASANGDAVRYEQVAPVYAIGVRSSSQSIPPATWTVITYTSEDDPSSLLSSGVVTLPSAGLWLVTGTVTMDLDGGGEVASMAIEQNGTAVISDTLPNISVTDPTLAQATVIMAAASDTVRLRVLVSGGSNRNCLGGRFTVAKIGL